MEERPGSSESLVRLSFPWEAHRGTTRLFGHPFIFFKFILCTCMCCQHLWRSGGSLWKLVLSWHVGCRDWAQVIGLCSKCPYPPNQLNVFDLKQSSKNSNSIWALCEEAWDAANPLQSLQSPGSSVFEVSFPHGVRWLSDFPKTEQGVCPGAPQSLPHQPRGAHPCSVRVLGGSVIT